MTLSEKLRSKVVRLVSGPQQRPGMADEAVLAIAREEVARKGWIWKKGVIPILDVERDYPRRLYWRVSACLNASDADAEIFIEDATGKVLGSSFKPE